jgi:hypothetical protein
MAHCVARDVEVHKLGTYFTTTFEFECACGEVHRGIERSTRPFRHVAYVKPCGRTKIYFDWGAARFTDACKKENVQ